MIVTRFGLPGVRSRRSSSFGFGGPPGAPTSGHPLFCGGCSRHCSRSGRASKARLASQLRRVWRADVTTLISWPDTAGTARFQQIIHLYCARPRPFLRAGAQIRQLSDDSEAASGQSPKLSSRSARASIVARALLQIRAYCIWVESMALAPPPPLVGAGRGGGSRGPRRLSNAPLLARRVGRPDPPSSILPHKGGATVFAVKLGAMAFARG